MSTAYEHFLAGNDLLVGLLKSLPAYEPSAALEETVLRLARTAQAQETDAPALPCFDPPLRMEAMFLAEARRVDAAQATRRAAIFRDITEGQSSRDALGSVVSAPAEQWLKARAGEAAAPHNADKARRRGWLGFTWRDLGLATTAALIATLGTQLYLSKDMPTATIVHAENAAAPTQTALAESAATDTETFGKVASKPATARARSMESDAAADPREARRERASTPHAAEPAPPAATPFAAEIADASEQKTLPAVAAAAPVRAEKRVDHDDAVAPATAPLRKADSAELSTPRDHLKEVKPAPASDVCREASLSALPTAVAALSQQKQCGSVARFRINPKDLRVGNAWADAYRVVSGDSLSAKTLPLELDPAVPIDTVVFDRQP